MIKKRLQIAGVALLLAGAGMLPFKDVLFKKALLYKPFGSENEFPSEGEFGENIRGAVEYNFIRKADLTTGLIDMAEVNKVLMQLDNRPMNKDGSFLQWREMGPDNIGGRTRAIVIDKDNPNVLYVGGVSGGVWKSTNAGTTWKRSGGRNLESLIVSCMVQTSDGTIFYGTGEQNFTRAANGDGNSGFIGRGIFISSDKGENFNQLKSTDPTTVWVKDDTWDNIHGLATVPGDPNKIYAATQGGLQVTTNKGESWSQVNIGAPASYPYCTDIRVSTDGQVIFAVMQPKTLGGVQIYRSIDGGNTWARVDNSASSPVKVNTSLSRCVVAIAPTRPRTVYLSAAKNDNKLDGIYVSDDAGETWQKIVIGGASNDPFSQDATGASPQGDYDNCIAVDPKDHNRIYVGGVHLFRGVRFGTQIQWGAIAFKAKAEGVYNPYYVHADKHAIVFDTLSKPYVMYIGTDGGVYKSTNVSNRDENLKYTAINNGYASTQFYGLGISPTHRDTVIGGTQDNGTLLVGRGGISELNANSILGGDGGHAAIAKIRRIYFAENQYGALQRSVDGRNFTAFYDNNVTGGFPFVAPFRLWEEMDYDTTVTYNDITKQNDTTVFLNPYASKLIVGGYGGIFLTSGALVMDKAPVFFKIGSIPGFSPNCMEISDDGDAVYIGGVAGTSGRVYRITGLKNYRKFTGSGANFNPQDYGVSLPISIYSKIGQAVTGIGLNPKDKNQIIATLGTYGASKTHVVMAENALAATPTFVDYSGNLPGFPVYDAAINPDSKNKVILGTEFGIWYADDIKSKDWKEENNGMERVPAFMVDFREYPNSDIEGPVFFAATHGRGMFRTETFAKVGINDKDAAAKHQPQMNIYPNPASEMTNLSLTLSNSSDVMINIYSIQGKLVDSYQHRGQPFGERKYSLNTAGYKPGTYFVKVSAQGIDKTSKLLIVR